MATPIQVTIDCAEPARLARFWAEALGYRLEEPPDGFATWQDYWGSRGLPPEEIEDGYDSIVTPTGSGRGSGSSRCRSRRPSRTGSIWTWGSAAAVRSRWRPAASGSTPRPSGWSRRGDRLVLDGEVIGHYAVVMADPEGNEFCLH